MRMMDVGYVSEQLDAIEQMARDRGITLDLATFREMDAECRQLKTKNERRRSLQKALSALAGTLAGGSNAAVGQLNREQVLATVREVIPNFPTDFENVAPEQLRMHLKEFSKAIRSTDEQIEKLDGKLRQFLLIIPNIPHTSVPVGKSAAD